jgi:hypothetical protein
LDLRKAWEFEQEKKRVFVTPEEAWLTLEMKFPVPPPILWEYLTVSQLEKVSSD